MREKEKQMKKWSKVSVVTTVYNTEKYIKQCLDSICHQTYSNLQIIVVNDASKGNISEIMQEYIEKDSRMQYINLEENIGLFHARKTGAEIADGEYICFVDSDDYIGEDYIRSMVKTAIEQHADLVKTRFVLTDGTRNYVHSYIYNQPNVVLEGKEILQEYFNQEGLDFSWHTVWNKLYKKSLWDKCVFYYNWIDEHLIMAEDFAYSTPLFAFAKKMVSISADEYFYMQRSEASTGIVKDKKKYEKNIGNLKTSFEFVEKFLKETKKEEYFQKFERWRSLYARFWYDNIERAGFSTKEKVELKNVLKQALKQEELRASTKQDNYFYSCSMDWNGKLQEAKQRILAQEIKLVSFDIFDTLLQRPFFKPTDLFLILELEQKEYLPYPSYSFSTFRVKAEIEARKRSKEEDITLEEIYEVLQDTFDLPKKNAEKLIVAEQEAEIRFCYPRRCAKELYELCLFLGKKIVITSDMYLPKETIENLLLKNGYTKYERLYLSSVEKKTKATGNLYRMLQKEWKLEPEEILHIGDNWDSDIERTKQRGYSNIFFPKAIEVFQNKLEFGGYPAGNSFGYVLNSWNAIRNNACSLEFFGIRCMYALIANEYFDNPFRCFHKDSDFNSDSYYMGLYAFGMHMYGIVTELIKHYGDRRKIHFVSRDGYLCKKMYDFIGKGYGAKAESNYLYLSRKAILPTGFQNTTDFYSIVDGMAEECIVKQTPESILKCFLNLELTEQLKEQLQENKIEPDKKFQNKKEFDKFILELATMESVKRHLENYGQRAKEYLKEVQEQEVLFDLGYNGTAQYLLSKLLNERIDAYYVYINKEKAMKYAKERQYSVKTFYDSTPGVSGCIREFFFSEYAPSCIGYQREKDTIVPVFEEKESIYVEWKLAHNIELGVMKFTELMKQHFGVMAKEFYIRNYDCSIPFEYLMHKSKDLDRWAFHCCDFEDEVYYADTKNLYEMWNEAVAYYFAPIYVKENEASTQMVTYGPSEIYKDGVAIAIFRKINQIAPFGSKRRNILKKVLGMFVGKTI